MTGDFGVDSVDDFLEKCRSEPPNFIVSDRVQGEAEVEPFKWSDPQSSPPYDAKRAALMFVSKIVSVAGLTPHCQTTPSLMSIRLVSKLILILSQDC